MAALLVSILLCAVFGLRIEGTIKMGLQGFGMLRVGRVAVCVRTVRPGRVYFLMGAG